MRNFLRILFCVLSVLCLAAAIPLGAVFGLICCFALIAGAVVFAVLMFAMKNGNGFRRQKPQPKEDFMNTAEENEAIRRNRENNG